MCSLRLIARYFFYIFLSYFFASYYFEFGVSQAAAIRFFLGCCVVLLIALFVLDAEIREILLHLFTDRLVLPFWVLFAYLLVHCFFYSDWQGMRRIFLLVVFFLSLLVFFKFEKNNLSLLIYRFCIVASAVSILIAILYLFSYVWDNGIVLPSKKNAMSETGFYFLSDYVNTVLAGMHLSFLFAFGLYGYFRSERTVLLALSCAAVFLIAGAVFITMARTAWVVCLSMLFIFVLFEVRYRLRRCVFLIIPFVLWGSTYLLSNLRFHLERGLTRRDEIWLKVWETIESAQQFFFGKGVSSPVDFVALSQKGAVQPHFHNIYLESLYRTGAIGLALFMVCVFLVLYRLYMQRSNGDVVFCFSLVFSITIGMFFDYSNIYYTPNLMWLVFWLPVVLAISSVRLERKLNVGD